MSAASSASSAGEEIWAGRHRRRREGRPRARDFTTGAPRDFVDDRDADVLAEVENGEQDHLLQLADWATIMSATRRLTALPPILQVSAFRNSRLMTQGASGHGVSRRSVASHRSRT